MPFFVEPLRSGYEDVATPVSDSNDCNCTTDGPDGFLDLTLKFKTQRIVEAVGDVNDGDVRVLTLTGVLLDPIPFETPIEGADCILIRRKLAAIQYCRGLICYRRAASITLAALLIF